MGADLEYEFAEPDPLRFRIKHLLYAIAVLGSGAAVFGGVGLAVGTLVSLFWWTVPPSTLRRHGCTWVLLAVVAGVWIFLLLPAVSTPRGYSRRMMCSNNLKSISLALHNYHDKYKSFPPTFIADDEGRPLHSWRVLLLPYLDHKALYDQYRFDEPWNGPNNSKLGSRTPGCFHCPERGVDFALAGNVSYFAPVGGNTVWPGDRGRRIAEISDGTSNTVFLVEHINRDTNWLEPYDPSFEEVLAGGTSLDVHDQAGHGYKTFFNSYFHGSNVAYADGRIRFLPYGIKESLYSRLLQANDGLEIRDEEFEHHHDAFHRRRYDNWYRLAVFVIMALLPLPWIWRKAGPSQKAGKPTA